MNEIPIHKHPPSHKRRAYIAGKALKTGFTTAYKLGLIKHRKPRTRALIIYNNHFLVVSTMIHPEHLSLPGGGIKEDETPASACAKEIREELGIHVSPAILTELGTFTREQIDDRFDVVCFLYEIHTPANKAIKPNHEIYEAQWIPFATLPSDLPPLVLLALRSYVDYIKR